MDIVNASRRIDVIVHTEPAAWWQVAAALGWLGLVAVLAAVAIVYLLPTRRWSARTRADKVQSWDRVRWALEAASDTDPKRRAVGFAALDRLSGSRSLDHESAEIASRVKEALDKH